MLRRHPDLIVPIRDRRQRRRYLTLKNFGIATAVLVVAFIIVSVRSEMRGRFEGDYGRLVQREIPSPVERKPVEVVQEAPAPVADATHADPMLIEPAARAQWLEGDPTATTTTIAPASMPVTVASVRGGSGELVVVGGPDGVSVVRTERRRPVLSGGFGRQ